MKTIKRQFCRKCLCSCVPTVSLSNEYGTLHWCAKDASDADRYRDTETVQR